jgi:hypothetical protein
MTTLESSILTFVAALVGYLVGAFRTGRIVRRRFRLLPRTDARPRETNL